MPVLRLLATWTVCALYLLTSCGAAAALAAHHARHNNHHRVAAAGDAAEAPPRPPAAGRQLAALLRPYDSRDYESEDPRPHAAPAPPRPEQQLEKSLLQREHTSSRPTPKCGQRHRKPEAPLADAPKPAAARPANQTPEQLTRFQSVSQCPTCYAAQYLSHEKTLAGAAADPRNKIDSESIRLEAIKQQILNKLGLKHRPVIKKKLPREIVLQSLYRAEEDNLDFFNDENSRHFKKAGDPKHADPGDKHEESSEAAASGEDVAYSTNEVQDDFYARTSEIIVFGDAGSKLNNQQLVEFSLAKYSDTGDQELRVKAATLWVKVSFHPLVTHAKKRLVTHRNVTLWVFRLIQDHISNKISSQEFDKFMEMATSLTVNLASLGWQKFDLTTTVRDWYQNVLKPHTTTESATYGQSSYGSEEDRDDAAAENISSTNYSSFRTSRMQYSSFNAKGRKTGRTESQKDINRLNYESIEFGNYQNSNGKHGEKEEGEEDQTDDQALTSKKLRLLIDCSGCKDLVQIHLFTTQFEQELPKKAHRKKLQHKQKNRDYEFYTYDGYYNVHSDVDLDVNKNRTFEYKRRKEQKQYSRSVDASRASDHKHATNASHENEEHRHSNHERNSRHNHSSPIPTNFHESDAGEESGRSAAERVAADVDAAAEAESDDPNRPFLVIHTDPNIMKRVRRRALDCSGALKGQCCKQRFYVNFTDLGWSDWILAPQGYYANYCMGSCNSVHRTPDTFLNYYTHVIHEYQKYGDLKGLQPCCAPVKFSSTSLIYFGPDSNIIKRDLPKMTVDECGCP